MAQLVRQLGHPEESERAERALVALGEPAVEPLLDSLRDADLADQRQRARARGALRVLGRMGPTAVGARDTLVTLLQAEHVSLGLDTLGALVELMPYAGGNAFEVSISFLHRQVAHEPFLRLYARGRARSQAPVSTAVEQLLAELERNRIFEREVIAEQLGRAGDVAALGPLHAMLMKRDVRPEGWDSLRHNEVVLPLEDDFALRAAEAMVAIAPGDRRTAVAWGVIAAEHPWPSRRLEALAAVAGMGPDAAEAVADVARAARSPRERVALEALETLGMIGPPACRAAVEVEAIARDAPSEAVAGQAVAVGKLLRAMMTEDVQREVAARRARAERERELRELVKDLSFDDRERREAAAAALRAAGEAGVEAVARFVRDRAGDPAPARDLLRHLGADAAAAVPLLLEQMRDAGAYAPRQTVELVAELGMYLGPGRRSELSRAIMARSGERWRCDSFSITTGGRREPWTLPLVAKLQLGAAPDAGALARYLVDENPYVRLAAAAMIGERAGAAATPLVPDVDLVHALARAAEAEHPKAFKVDTGLHRVDGITADLDDEIHAAARRALSTLAEGADASVAAAAREALAQKKR